MEAIEVLKYLVNSCVRNEDGSLTVDTEELSMIEKSISEYIPTYAGWSYPDVVDVGLNLGYNIPREVADNLIQDICRHDCEITWESIEDAIELDLYKYNLEQYAVEDEE